MDNSALIYQSFLPFSFSNQASEFHNSNQSLVSAGQLVFSQEFSNKRKTLDVSDSSCGNSSSSSPQPQTSGRGKKAKTNPNANAKEEEKPRQVVHVRARRGEATDSHSLAERVRRKKINERLRCLQDIVPGCYKTMGMAVMLDEIINYVQSLQNQVEFLSMKLTAASTNSAMERMQREKEEEAKELERWMGEGYVGVGFHSTSPWS
ncbi:hypothetical protein V6N11_082712 [Hibiscus sabdariffa]|uniref:BHLH domain-containing protein n=2 Tax=Hibiscus sabdariffa TaxID=183260 RepID=A0ABR2D6E8_9ROSI